MNTVVATGDVSAVRSQAIRAFQAGEVTEAIRLLTPLVDTQDITPARTRALLAVMHATRQDWVHVRDVLAPAIADLDPQAIALYLLASTLIGEAPRGLDDVRASGNTRWVDDIGAVVEYARACTETNHPAAAERALQWVLARAPAHGRARDALADAYLCLCRSDEAVHQWRARVAHHPSNATYQMDLAMGLLKVGLVEEAQAARERAEDLGLSGENVSQALYLHLFDERSTGASVRAAHERSSQGPAVVRPRASPRSDGQLRVGVLSSEFDCPPATFFLTPLLDAIDRRRCRIIRYNSRLKSRAPARTPHADDLWRNIPAGEDDALRVFDEDRLDVLVDFAGCFAGNRRDVLRHAVAPVQATYPNYPGTTGIDAVRWILTDTWLTPPGTEDEYTERVYRLTGGALCYKPPVSLPVVRRDRPGRPVTFGLFQRAIKYSRTTWDLVAGALRATPTSRLLIHSSDRELDVEGSPLRTRIHQQLDARDIDPTRVSFIGGRELETHLAIVGTVDIALDTYPFSGQTTAMECLWMGVPIVSRRGPLHASRVSGALMAQVGLDEYVASDDAGYVGAATRLAGDVSTLRHIHARLRQTMIDAGLTSGTRLAREIEDALETLVRGRSATVSGGTGHSA